MEVKSIDVNVNSKTFEDGKVKWELSDGGLLPTEVRSPLEIQAGSTSESEYFALAKRIALKATMTGGRGEHAWRHTQLMRANRECPGEGTQMKMVVKMIGKLQG